MSNSCAHSSSNTVWHHATVTRQRRERLNGHRGALIWTTGLSASGKSTLCHAVEEQLHRKGCRTYVFDGDNVRHGLCRDLGFSKQDRDENIRRIGEMAKLFVDAGMLVLAAFISPYRVQRQMVRSLVEGDNFIEVYCRCPLHVCEMRDVKGHYRRARLGQIKEFTGISASYEDPEDAELVVDTDVQSLEYCVKAVLSLIEGRGIILNPFESTESRLEK